MKKITVLLLALLLLAASAFAEETHQHTWGEYTVTRQPTCAQAGEQVRTCTECGAAEASPIPPLQHSFDAWKTVSDTSHSRVCRVCGFAETELHDKVIDRAITQASSENLGKHALTCSRCGYSYTRFVSIYGSYVSAEGVDITGNGTSYIKFNSVSIPKGGTKKLSLAAGAELELYASTDLSYDVYANSRTGEFKGLVITLGQGVLSVGDGQAELDFIRFSPETGLKVQFKAESSALYVYSAGSGFESFSSLKKGNQVYIIEGHSLLNGTRVEGGMGVYPSDGGGIKMYFEGAALSGDALASVVWEYDTAANRLSAKSSLGTLKLFSASREIAQGNINMTFSPEDVLWGWYLTLDDVKSGLSYISPTYSFSGEITSENSQTAFVENTPAPSQPADASAADGIPQIKVLTPSDTLSYTASDSPRVEVKFFSGKYAVRVSKVPKGLTYERIELAVYYNHGGFKLISQFGTEALFELGSDITKFSVDAIFINSKGKTVRVNAGEYEYKSE